MHSFRKTTQTAIAIIVVMIGGLWVGVTFVGESWSDQGRYVLTLLSLLLSIMLGAALLVVVGKGAALLWNKLTGHGVDQDDNLPPTSPDNTQL